MFAAGRGLAEIEEILLTYNADVKARYKGKTALEWATDLNQVKTVELLR
jgi:ankyrin repeat protein